MSLRAAASAAIWVFLAGCSHPAPAPHSHPIASPVSCRQQYQTWKHGPAGDMARTLSTTVRTAMAAERSADPAGMKTAMEQLVPAALAMADHPIPHCADPASLYAKLVNAAYATGHSARSATALSALRRIAATLKSVREAGHQLAAEIGRTAGTRQ